MPAFDIAVKQATIEIYNNRWGNVRRTGNFFRDMAHTMASNGEMFGTPPMGYRLTKRNGVKTVVVDSPYDEIVSSIFHLYVTNNYSLDQISDILSEKYDRIIARNTIHNVITNKFYIGKQVIKDKEYDHSFERIIPEYLWKECNDILHSYRKKRTKYAGKFFLFRSLIECKKCGSSYTAEEHKDIKYYRCNKSNTDKDRHTKSSYLKEADILKLIIGSSNQFGISNDIIMQKPESMRLFVRMAFGKIVADGIELSITNQPYSHLVDFKKFIQSEGRDGLPIQLDREFKDILNKAVSSNDPLLEYCKDGKEVDQISSHFGWDIIDTQIKLMDYQLRDLIEEEGSLWKAK